jgi:hypothetical protein
MSNGGGAAAGGRGADVVGGAIIEEDPPPQPNSGDAPMHTPNAIKSSRRVVLQSLISFTPCWTEKKRLGIRA